ncbi:hypothetical protein LTS18_007469 [Coniosporium uncinatum]|uniref:Uncharacterized protein n=1 Tax=Coniosporium uncinatum TaxID=93489 RepID=A0ACC3D316_9PEZI|nr:hypothetical protein LTS18_007469 [Coniosporium uncinatum]
MDTSLTPLALFSPSKAAQQRAQAQDWHHVDTWLSSKYQGRSVPAFERNEETLKALQSLAAANERADEEREVLWAVEKAALRELEDSATKHADDTTIVAALTTNLPTEGKQHLDILAVSTIALDAPDSHPSTLAHSLVSHTMTAHTLSNHLAYLTTIQSHLQSRLQELRSLLNEVRSDAFKPSRDLPRQTADWTRNTKILRAKIGEYTDRLASLLGSDVYSSPSKSPRKRAGTIEDRAPEGVDWEDIVRMEQSVLSLRKELEELVTRVERFHDLPPDKEDARKEVERKMRELERLRRQRDGLFEGLVDG